MFHAIGWITGFPRLAAGMRAVCALHAAAARAAWNAIGWAFVARRVEVPARRPTQMLWAG